MEKAFQEVDEEGNESGFNQISSEKMNDVVKEMTFGVRSFQSECSWEKVSHTTKEICQKNQSQTMMLENG